MTTPAHRRHDTSDEAWKKPEPHLPGRQGSSGGIAQDNRQFIDAVFWVMRTQDIHSVPVQLKGIQISGYETVYDLFSQNIYIDI